MGWGERSQQKEENKTKRSDYFRKAKAYVHDQGLKCMVWGDPSVGKTYFALSFPEPIYVIDTEFGVAPVTRHFPDKEIFIHEAAILDPSTDEPDVDASLKSLEKAIAQLKNIEKGTIVIDSGTDIWQWLGAWVEQQARKSGKITSAGTPQRLEWGRANLRWRQLILRLMAKPVHFVITAQVAEEYDSRGQQTGNYKPRVQKQTPHMCDIILAMERKYVKKGKGPAEEKYIATMEKCRFQRGMDMELEDVTFDKLAEALKDKLGVVIDGTEVE